MHSIPLPLWKAFYNCLGHFARSGSMHDKAIIVSSQWLLQNWSTMYSAGYSLIWQFGFFVPFYQIIWRLSWSALLHILATCFYSKQRSIIFGTRGLFMAESKCTYNAYNIYIIFGVIPPRSGLMQTFQKEQFGRLYPLPSANPISVSVFILT